MVDHPPVPSPANTWRPARGLERLRRSVRREYGLPDGRVLADLASLCVGRLCHRDGPNESKQRRERAMAMTIDWYYHRKG